MTKRVRKAVVPVAGFGTRVLPGSKTTPKELLNVVDRPILSYVVEEARGAGIEHFVFVTGRGKGAIEDYFDHHVELETQLADKGKDDILADVLRDLPRPGEMSFVRQMAPLGLGHAVWCARHIIGDEPFAVMLPDMLIHGRGAVINIAFTAARRGRAGQSAYAAAKFGLLGFTQSLFAEVRDHGIKVASIIADMVDTDSTESDPQIDRAKLLQPDDVADAVVGVLTTPARNCQTEIILEPQYDPYVA